MGETLRDRHGIWTFEESLTQHAFDTQLARAISCLPDGPPKSLADLGCGNGSYCKFFSDLGWKNVHGYEGTPNKWGIYDNIAKADLSQPCSFPKYEMVLCLEVGEHIPEEFESTFLDNVTSAVGKILILSWAVPGQGGFGHFNCRENSYIIGDVRGRGLHYNRVKSELLRRAAALYWFRNTVMVFERE